MGSLRDREVTCSVSDRQGSNFESCVWRTVSSQSSHHPQEALLAQFSLYVHKGGLKPDSFHFTSLSAQSRQYRDRWKPEVGTMPHYYRMTPRVLFRVLDIPELRESGNGSPMYRRGPAHTGQVQPGGGGGGRQITGKGIVRIVKSRY